MRFVASLLLLLLLAVFPTAGAGTAVAGEGSAEAAGRGPLTLSNLLEHEADWPYQVALARAWKPAGHAGEFGWGVGTLGVLIRMGEGERLRVDFGRFGIHWVPAEATDVLARANRVRSGELRKTAPNLAVALNHRLLDPRGRQLADWGDDLFLVPKSVFILIFADPADDGFARIAARTAAWAKEPGTVLVLIAPAGRPDAHVYKYCFDSGWKGAFLMNMFAAPYAEAQLEPGASRPFVQLLTPEGRLIHGASWSDDAAAEVERAAAEIRR